jgi:hypothetical protein
VIANPKRGAIAFAVGLGVAVIVAMGSHLTTRRTRKALTLPTRGCSGYACGHPLRPRLTGLPGPAARFLVRSAGASARRPDARFMRTGANRDSSDRALPLPCGRGLPADGQRSRQMKRDSSRLAERHWQGEEFHWKHVARIGAPGALDPTIRIARSCMPLDEKGTRR